MPPWTFPLGAWTYSPLFYHYLNVQRLANDNNLGLKLGLEIEMCRFRLAGYPAVFH